MLDNIFGIIFIAIVLILLLPLIIITSPFWGIALIIKSAKDW